MDFGFKLATVIIAIVNVILTLKLFFFKSNKEDIDKEKDRKIQLLKTLVLDHNLKNYYEIFHKLNLNLERLKLSNEAENNVLLVEDENSKLFILLRSQFYDFLLAIDEKLYEEIKGLSDDLQQKLSNVVFDTSVNFKDELTFNERIIEVVNNSKSEILKKLFQYRG